MFFGAGCVTVLFAFWIGVLVGMKVHETKQSADGKAPPVR